MSDKKILRRDILKIGTTGAIGLAGSFYLNKVAPQRSNQVYLNDVIICYL